MVITIAVFAAGATCWRQSYLETQQRIAVSALAINSAHISITTAINAEQVPMSHEVLISMYNPSSVAIHHDVLYHVFIDSKPGGLVMLKDVEKAERQMQLGCAQIPGGAI